ncbi:hypothetical protein GF339_23025, partial [candidate division KSB3 bacterium]|nr:hypothetical protein [candidate division KSB3 bacterium]MBD3327477.1 hypothetical protein [candidate division KSB3 bacterium]
MWPAIGKLYFCPIPEQRGAYPSTMKQQWLKKLQGGWKIKAQMKRLHDYIYAMSNEPLDRPYYEENRQKIFQTIECLILQLQDILTLQQQPPAPQQDDDNAAPPERENFRLADLLTMFHRTIENLQRTSPQIQQDAIDILYSYFIELQGLYDLLLVSTYQQDSSNIPLFPASSEEQTNRSFRLPADIENDSLIQEYHSIPYTDL